MTAPKGCTERRPCNNCRFNADVEALPVGQQAGCFAFSVDCATTGITGDDSHKSKAFLALRADTSIMRGWAIRVKDSEGRPSVVMDPSQVEIMIYGDVGIHSLEEALGFIGYSLKKFAHGSL